MHILEEFLSHAMEHTVNLNGSDVPSLHEYPDPDHAACITRYPWSGEYQDYEDSRQQAPENWPWHGTPDTYVPHLLSSQGQRVYDDNMARTSSARSGSQSDLEYQVSDDAAS